MIDLLAVWGVTSAAGLIFKPILEDLYQELKGLAKDATEDWVKDLFKERLSDGSSAVYDQILSRLHREPLDIAAGKAIKGFLEIFQDCLDDADLDENAIAEYTNSIKLLLKPGGIFVTSTMCMGDAFNWFKLIAPIGKALGFFPLVRIFTAQHLIESLTDAGLAINYQWQPSKNKAIFIVAKKPGEEI